MSEAKLCVALDFNHASEAKNLISQLESLPVVMKIGLRLLPQFTQQDWAELVKKKVAFFIDAKLHDIPTQVEASVKTWAEWGASFLTLHLSGGPKMIESAVRAAENHPLKLLGVSVLTSLSENDLKTMGFNLNCEQVVKKWGQMAVENGLYQFVSSVAEVDALKSLDSRVYCCSPGIRMLDEMAHADQQRSFTVEQAVAKKVDLLVMGRSLLKSSNPRQRAESILDVIKNTASS